MMPIISNTVDKVQDDSSTICEKVTSESIEKETAETVVNETPEILLQRKIIQRQRRNLS